MLRLTLAAWASGAYSSVGHLPSAGAPRSPRVGSHIPGAHGLHPLPLRCPSAAATTHRRRWGGGTQLAEPAEAAAASVSALSVLADDDVVLDTPVALFQRSTDVSLRVGRHASAAATDDDDADVVVDPYVEARVANHQHPAARGIAQDVVDLVTDAFQAAREAEVGRRRRALYALTHPDPSDYTYGGKLVPPPPLSFGKVAEEAVRLGEEVMAGQPYSLVRQAGVRAEHASGAGATSDAALVEAAIEVDVSTSRRRRGAAAAAAAAVVAPHRNRKREENIFRDHNYFFEINELYQEIVLVGRASAGKSSLINALLGQPGLAKTSSTPHTTRKINFYQSVSPEELRRFHEQQHHNQLVKLPGGGLQLTFVDMPGYGMEGMSDKWRDAAIELTDAYFGVRRSVNTVLFCIDCERGLTKTDIKYFQWLENVQGVFYIVLTKCDSVPHSRICSVMRQVYVLITENRRKFRKVFPYIIPVSAHDGTNVDVLRGLVTETSGLIPGDKLRDLLKRKREAALSEGLARESARLAQVRAEERAQAKTAFLAARGSDVALERSVPGLDRRCTNPDSVMLGSSPAPSGGAGDVRTTREKESEGANGEGSGDAWNPFAGAQEADTVVAERERANRRRRFLAWRAANPLERASTPYGAVRYRVNTGLENPVDEEALRQLCGGPRLGVTEASTEPSPLREPWVGGESVVCSRDEANPRPAVPCPSLHDGEGSTLSVAAGAAPLPSLAPASRVLGLVPPAEDGAATDRYPAEPTLSAPHPQGLNPRKTGGRVSAFLDTLERFGSRARPARVRPEWRRRRVASPRLLAEDASGRLAAFEAGRRAGPALLSVGADMATRQAAWQAARLSEVLRQESPSAPWDAVARVSRRLESERQAALMRGMKRGEREAYLRDAGHVTESFEKFEGEVTAAKYMNEVRQAPTLRSREQMHLNATAKISYRSMPPGLWKRYGQQDSHWPTPSVLGREKDESHVRLASPAAAAASSLSGRSTAPRPLARKGGRRSGDRRGRTHG